MPNIFSEIPASIPEEIFEDIIATESVRVERILSHGQSSPATGWYDQTENEWVIVLKGQGVIEFNDGRMVTLDEGDYININAGEKHRVVSTSSQVATVWLAVFYQ